MLQWQTKGEGREGKGGCWEVISERSSQRSGVRGGESFFIEDAREGCFNMER